MAVYILDRPQTHTHTEGERKREPLYEKHINKYIMVREVWLHKTICEQLIIYNRDSLIQNESHELEFLEIC